MWSKAIHSPLINHVEFLPTSSTTTKDLSVACVKMKAVSNISDIKVDWCCTRLSLAPILANTRSTIPKQYIKTRPDFKSCTKSIRPQNHPVRRVWFEKLEVFPFLTVISNSLTRLSCKHSSIFISFGEYNNEINNKTKMQCGVYFTYLLLHFELEQMIQPEREWLSKHFDVEMYSYLWD